MSTNAELRPDSSEKLIPSENASYLRLRDADLKRLECLLDREGTPPAFHDRFTKSKALLENIRHKTELTYGDCNIIDEAYDTLHFPTIETEDDLLAILKEKPGKRNLAYDFDDGVTDTFYFVEESPTTIVSAVHTALAEQIFEQLQAAIADNKPDFPSPVVAYLSHINYGTDLPT